MKRILFILLLTIPFIGFGQLRGEGNYKDGKKDGLWKYYYDTNQLREEGNYQDGKREGLWKYYILGQLRTKGNYENGKKEGFWKHYYPNGKLREEGNFKDGELISVKCWDKNGTEIKCK